MSKKPEVVARPLDVITREIGIALRSETVCIIKSGTLLLEAKAQINKHGAWLPWLEENFDLSLRTAQNYMQVAEFAAQKRNDVAYLDNIAPAVLYALAAGSYEPEVTASILKLAKERRVDQSLVAAMVLARTRDEDLKEALSKAEQRQLEQQQLEDEANAILDGPPPVLPPPEPVPLETDKYLHEKLSALIIELKKLVTKSTERFVACEIEPSDLENAADFLKQVAAKIVSRRAA
jgi:hypothetical protein